MPGRLGIRDMSLVDDVYAEYMSIEAMYLLAGQGHLSMPLQILVVILMCTGSSSSSLLIRLITWSLLTIISLMIALLILERIVMVLIPRFGLVVIVAAEYLHPMMTRSGDALATWSEIVIYGESFKNGRKYSRLLCFEPKS